MKGIAQTLWVVVAAVVVVVVALVVITIFGGGMQQFASLTEAKAYCAILGTPVCQMHVGDTVPAAPATWTAQNIKVGDSLSTCATKCNDWATACTKANNWQVKCA